MKMKYLTPTESLQGCMGRENGAKWVEIAAPFKDFNTNGMRVVDSKLVQEVRDPVVLKPVFFQGMKHYLIVTAWGLEASDELVVNPNHN